MKELVFLLEEPSARAMLETLLPRILDPSIQTRLIPFEGKQDLEKQLERKIRGYQNPLARFIVLRDQDSNPDCEKIKNALLLLCARSGKGAHCLVRIACQELETFYLADLASVGKALDIPKLASLQGQRKYRSPDSLGNPSRELRSLTGNRYQKISGSREIGRHLDVDNTRSPSFQNLIGAVVRMERQLLIRYEYV